jgi:hypothetical protein
MVCVNPPGNGTKNVSVLANPRLLVHIDHLCRKSMSLRAIRM